VKRLGVIGTMVWDTIHGRDPSMGPIDEWGGIAYALAALEAELPNGWEIVPLIKVGRDLAPRANEFLGCLTKRSAADRFVEVTEPNNRCDTPRRRVGPNSFPAECPDGHGKNWVP